MSANLWHLTFLRVDEVQWNLERRLRLLEDWSEDKEIPEVLGATFLHASDWGNDGKYDPRGSTKSREAIAVAIVPDARTIIGGGGGSEKPATEEPHLRTRMTYPQQIMERNFSKPHWIQTPSQLHRKQNHYCRKSSIRTTHELHNQQRRDDFTAPLRNRTNEQGRKTGEIAGKAHVRRRSVVLAVQIWSSEAPTYWTCKCHQDFFAELRGKWGNLCRWLDCNANCRVDKENVTSSFSLCLSHSLSLSPHPTWQSKSAAD